jgi:hypothetical protein
MRLRGVLDASHNLAATSPHPLTLFVAALEDLSETRRREIVKCGAIK